MGNLFTVKHEETSEDYGDAETCGIKTDYIYVNQEFYKKNQEQYNFETKKWEKLTKKSM